MSCIVASCCASSWKLCSYAGIQYNYVQLIFHKQKAQTCQRVAHTNPHIEDIQSNFDKFQKHASCVIPQITKSNANENIALVCVVHVSQKKYKKCLSWNHGLAVTPTRGWSRALWSTFGARGQENCGSRAVARLVVSPLEAPRRWGTARMRWIYQVFWRSRASFTLDWWMSIHRTR